jgi:hypothetical protein
VATLGYLISVLRNSNAGDGVLNRDVASGNPTVVLKTLEALQLCLFVIL